MNRMEHAGQLNWAVAFMPVALAIVAAQGADRSVAPAAAATLVTEHRGSAAGLVGVGADCRLQDMFKRRSAVDGKPALRTALYTWGPLEHLRNAGGRADMEPRPNTNGKYKRATPSPARTGARAGWLHEWQPRSLACTNTIDA